MDISNHLRKAEEASRRRNYKHAIGLYRQVLTFKPDHGEARKGFHATLYRRAEVQKSSPALAKIGGCLHLLSISMGRWSKKPSQVARACDKYLVLDPHNERIHFILGEALEQGGHLNSAAAVYEAMGEGLDSRADALREAGSVHYRLGNIEKAMECLDQCLEMNPHDAEADKLRKNVAAESAMTTGGYAKAQSSRELIRDKGQAKQLEKSQRIHRTEDEITDEIGSLEAALEENASDNRSRRALVSHLSRRGDFEKALEVVEAGLELDPNSSDLKDSKGDLQSSLYQREIKKLRQRLEAEDREEIREDLKDLEGEALEFDIEECRRRVDERPTELELWYRYGSKLLQSRNVDDAVEAFQKSVRDPKRRLDSLTKLSKCFFAKGLYELAEKQLLTALESLSSTGDRAKEALYNLGVIAEKDGRPADALKYYSRIYEVDIGFRDVAKKIDTLK